MTALTAPKKTYVGRLADPVVRLLLRADELARATQDAAHAAAEQDLDNCARLEPGIRLLTTKLTRLIWRHFDRYRRGQLDRSKKETCMRETAAEEAAITRDEFDALVEKAVYGNEEALDDLRQVLRENPAIYRRLGDLSKHVQQALVELATGDSVLARESFELRIGELRRELAQDAATPLENLLVEQVITTWLDVNAQQLGFAQPGGKESYAKRWEQRLDRAQKRHLAAITALAELQRTRAGEGCPVGRDLVDSGLGNPSN